MFRVQAKGGKVYEGDGFAIDPVTKALTLKKNDEFIILNPNNILSISGNFTGINVEAQTFQISAQELRTQEETALRAAEKSLESINFNVSGDIQALYDRMSNLFSNCCWNGDSILILDDYLVEPPNYDHVRVKEGGAASGLDRISRMLDGERKKLKLNV